MQDSCSDKNKNNRISEYTDLRGDPRRSFFISRSRTDVIIKPDENRNPNIQAEEEKWRYG